MERRFGKARRVWVMDRGMVSAENIAWLNATGRRYVLGTARSELKRWSRELAERSDWRHIREDVQVKLCRGPDGLETFLLCRSASRIEKERAMHQPLRQPHRSRTRLARPTHRRRARGALDRGALERQIGRLLERHARAAARYAISIEEDPSLASGLRLQLERAPRVGRVGGAERRHLHPAHQRA